MKEEEVLSLSKKCSFNAVKAFSLKLEASGREYWRIIDEYGESMVLCYLDPKIANHSVFINISNDLKENKVCCSNVTFHKKELGVTLQDDLGDNDLLSALNDANKKDLLEKSLEILIKLQNAKISGLKRFSLDELSEQMHSFNEVFCRKFLNISPHKSATELFSETIDQLEKQPWLNCHFDFERRNLVLNKFDNLTIIDFQDMKIGPIGIDLAGILIDHYYEADISEVLSFLDFYSSKSQNKFSNDELFEYLRWGCIQRNIRIMGTLSNLFVSKNRSYRLKDLPMILLNLIQMVPEEKEFKDFLIEEVKPNLYKRILDL